LHRNALTGIDNNENIAIAHDRILTVDAEHNIKTTGSHMELGAADSSLEVTGKVAQLANVLGGGKTVAPQKESEGFIQYQFGGK